jgi:hypothetical protein
MIAQVVVGVDVERHFGRRAAMRAQFFEEHLVAKRLRRPDVGSARGNANLDAAEA